MLVAPLQLNLLLGAELVVCSVTDLIIGCARTTHVKAMMRHFSLNGSSVSTSEKSTVNNTFFRTKQRSCQLLMMCKVLGEFGSCCLITA